MPEQRQPLGHSLIDSLIAARWLLLVIALVVGVAAMPWAGQLKFDRSIETMFPPSGELVNNYRQLKETFGGNEIVMAVYQDDDLLAIDGEGIRRLRRMHDRLAAVPGVRAVLSLDQLLGGDGLDIVRDDHPSAYKLRELFAGYTHSSDGRVASLVCMLKPTGETSVPRHETIGDIRSIIGEQPGGMVAGEPAMVSEGFRLVEADGRKLATWSTVLLAITILLCLRSIRWVLIPIVVVQWTLLVTRATLVLAGVRLSMVSSMLTAIVTVVGVATVIHIAVRFQQARRAGLGPRESLADAARLLAVPIFWSCATDAVGFGSLLASDVTPVREFGLMMAVGALLVLPGVVLVVPGLALLRAGRGGAAVEDAPAISPEQLGPLMSRIERHRALFLVTLLVVVGLFGWGMNRLEIETDFTKNFRGGSRIVRAYEFVESRLGGAGVFDITLPAPARLDWNYMQRVLRLEQRLREEVVVVDERGEPTPGLTKVLSLADGVVAGSPVEINGLPLRIVRDSTARKGVELMHERIPAFVDALYFTPTDENETNSDGANTAAPTRPARFRIMLRARERQPAAEKLSLIAQVDAIVRDELEQDAWAKDARLSPPDASADESPVGTLDQAIADRAHVTGYFVLLTNLIASLLEDQWTCFGIATLGIAVMMMLAFRSPTLAAAALVPNALPIIMVLGGMGWLGLKMNMGAAMIAAVSMGLSVDSSIHYISSFRRARRDGSTVVAAIVQTQRTVGPAVVFSTLALIVGFAVLVTSQFIPTVYFGVLVSLAMLGGLFGNLLVLPFLLLLVSPGDR